MIMNLLSFCKIFINSNGNSSFTSRLKNLASLKLYRPASFSNLSLYNGDIRQNFVFDVIIQINLLNLKLISCNKI